MAVHSSPPAQDRHPPSATTAATAAVPVPATGTGTGTGTTTSPPAVRQQDALAELASLIVGAHPLGRVLARVAELAATCVPGVGQVSVTLIEAGTNARTAAFHGHLAPSLDERQYATGSGPCIDAAESGRTIRIDDTGAGAEARADGTVPYPEFTAVAARQGVRSVVSLAMPMPLRIQAALNVYVLGPTPLDDDAVQVLQAFADRAAVALANHSLYATAVTLSEDMQAAMRSRAVIEQAKGVVMGRLHCTEEEAFAHLAKASQRSNRKLRVIAAEVVAGA